MKAVNIFNTFPDGVYSLILVGCYGSNEFWKAAVSLFVSFGAESIQYHLMNIRRRI
jgi:hypothetical protein